MKKYAFILWAALTMTGTFTACTDNDSPMTEQTEAKTVTIRATIDGNIGSRVALTDDVANSMVKIDWKQGDDFKINVNGTDYTFTYTENNKFECRDGNFPATFTNAGTVTATYPATTPTAYANQSGTLEGAASLLTMTATLDVEAEQSTENLALTFKHNNSIVKLTLSNEDFKEKSVTWVTLKSGSTAVATVTGTFTGDADKGSIVAYFVVEPRAMVDVSIRAVCEYKNYAATLTNNTLGIGKLYHVTKQMSETTPMGDKTAAQAVKGDFAMTDGSFISKDATLTDEQKANVRGIVFWTETEDNGPSTLVGNAVADKVMLSDFPNCTHGLIVSLKNVSTGTKWQNSYTIIASWQNSTAFNPENKNDYKSIASGTGATDLMNYILGYQNTKLLKTYNEGCDEANKVLPVSLLDEFSRTNPAPANTTGWFIPSVKELHMLCYKDVANVWDAFNVNYTVTKTVVNASLDEVDGDSFGNNDYRSSTESATNKDNAFELDFEKANVFSNDKETLNVYVRAVCAY